MSIKLLFLVGLLSLGGCTTASDSSSVHWVTLTELRDSLKLAPPISVGFDVDDTVLFSSPGFYHGQQKYSPGGTGYLRSQAFWTETNREGDLYSIPKESARQLIRMHQLRGDNIYFITGRPHTDGEQLTATLKRTFDIKDMHPVVFTSGPEKTRFIESHHLKIYYGDSDADITSARNAGARPVRVIRAANSTNQPLPANGALGEEVLKDSFL